MPTTTLLLSRRQTPDSHALWRAASVLGWNVVRARGYEPPPELAEGARRIVLYAETLLADALGSALELALLEPDAEWLARLPARYRLRDVDATRLGEVREVRERAFVKPASEKAFAPRVYEPGEIVDEARAFPDSLPVLIAEPVRFELETRAFVADRNVATLSAYLRDGALAEGDDGAWALTAEERAEAVGFLEGMLADPAVALPPGVVIDVGRIEGRGLAVVEANPAWSSGLCGCEPRAVLRVLEGAVLPGAEVDEALERWVRRV